jgi:hypothetical protein
VSVGAEGYFIASKPLGPSPLDFHLTPLPREDNVGYEWVDPIPDRAAPHNCGSCHAEIYREWAGSAHGRSATGRHFRNLYEGTDWHGKPGIGWGLLAEHPLGAGVCSSCHAPAVRDDDPAFYDLRKLQGTGVHGVHCDYCHKIAGLGEGAIGLSHGRFNLRLLRPAEGQLFFGPLDDVDRGEDSYSSFYRDSRYCASCHEGVVFGVPVYTTYSEWLESPARRIGRQCQDCHMVPTGRMRNFAPGHGGLQRDPKTIANHRFFDGDKGAMLQRCLDVGATFEFSSNSVLVRLRVSAEGAGHRVPTGFVDRHLILWIEARDKLNRVLGALDGSVLPAAAGAALAGKPGRLYAKFLRGDAGRGPVPFWTDVPDVLDNRLDPGVGDALEMTFPLQLVEVRVRILFRRFWQEVARDKGWPDEDLMVLDKTFRAAQSVSTTQPK